MRIAVGRQVMPEDMKPLTVHEYFATAFHDHKNNLDKLISQACETVNFSPSLDSKISSFSGGQQARLLLAHALIQEPDILLLDEPTNNLDHVGLEHLLGFLMMYEKTAIVISHDAEFLNAFTDGVLYLDVYTQKIEQYTGTYYDVVEEIKARIERENMQNARAETELKAKRAQAEVFAHKGGKLRAVAKRMREAADEAEESVVDVRREDKTIRPFEIPAQEFDAFFNGQVLEITSVDVWEGGERVPRETPITVRRNQHVLISGPNGIGKSTFLDELATGKAKGATIAKGVRIGYYKQDFSNLDYGAKAFDILRDSMDKFVEQDMRAAAAGFLLTGKELDLTVASLSEGQKALLQYCRIMLQKPGLLIMDEPTNHVCCVCEGS
jgi:ATP-binding cassette subfamily F protein 3